MNIPERLDKLRVKLDLTWDVLAERLKTSRSMLHYVIKGDRQPSPRLLGRIEELESSAGVGQAGIEQEKFQIGMEVGRLMESGVTAGEILKRLRTSEKISYSKTASEYIPAAEAAFDSAQSRASRGHIAQKPRRRRGTSRSANVPSSPEQQGSPGRHS